MRSSICFYGFMYFFFMAFGAVVFYLLENVRKIPVQQYFKNVDEDYIRYIQNLEKVGTEEEIINIVRKTHAVEIESLYHKVETAEPVWDMDGSFFFSVGLATTIGYGNVSPSTSGGKIFCMIFIMVGVPLNMVFMRSAAELHSLRWQKLIRNPVIKAIDSKFMQHVFILQDVLYSLSTIIILPTVVLMYSEHWSFLEGLYYSVITLSTTGFGDYVAGQRLKDNTTATIITIYKIFLFLWFLYGISYLTMLFSYAAHHYIVHWTYAFVIRNKRPGFVKIYFTFEGVNYHEALYGVEALVRTTVMDVPDTFHNARSREDIDFLINRFIRTRRQRLRQLHYKRNNIKKWILEKRLKKMHTS